MVAGAYRTTNLRERGPQIKGERNGRYAEPGAGQGCCAEMGPRPAGFHRRPCADGGRHLRALGIERSAGHARVFLRRRHCAANICHIAVGTGGGRDDRGHRQSSILVNIPGEATSVVTTLDGCQMAKQGRAGPALAIAAIGSFIAGCASTVLIAVLGAPLTKIALAFGPAEYFSLMVLGLIFAVVLAKGSVLKAIAMIVLGLLLSMVGSDIETGASRMAFNIPELADGLGFATVAMGVFGFAEIIRNLDDGMEMSRDLVQQKITGLMPTKKDLIDSAPAILRGTILGSILGILPGGGAVIASFAAYTLEKKIARNPQRFGRGAIEGVAAPESANNAAAQTSFIPLLTLGIPPNAVMALMVGAMTIHGIVPGPQIMTKQPHLFWGMIASMWLRNLMLLIINLPLIGLWVRFLKVPYRLLFPSIVVFCCIGIYSINNAPVDVIVAVAFGLFGYWLIKHDFEPAPLLRGMVLGPLMEENL